MIESTGANLTTTFLLLIRHGENDWVGSNRLAGRTPGVSLNEKGRQQAEALAQKLADRPIRAVYSSPLVRCIETATPTAEALGLPVRVEEGVLEGDFGDWQGQALKDLAKLPRVEDGAAEPVELYLSQWRKLSSYAAPRCFCARTSATEPSQ